MEAIAASASRQSAHFVAATKVRSGSGRRARGDRSRSADGAAQHDGDEHVASRARRHYHGSWIPQFVP
jgi:hypothetical protein